MDVDMKIIKDTLVIRIHGELDHHSSDIIKSKIDYYLSLNKARNILFDLSDLTFMDSSGIGLFMGRYKKIKVRNGKAALCNINKSIRRIFDFSGLMDIYQEFKSIDNALNEL